MPISALTLVNQSLYQAACGSITTLQPKYRGATAPLIQSLSRTGKKQESLRRLFGRRYLRDPVGHKMLRNEYELRTARHSGGEKKQP